MDLIMVTGGLALWTVLLAFAWVIRAHSDASPDDPETVVGVQRHGRTFFVRRDMLDSLDGSYEPDLWDRLRDTLVAAPSGRLRAVVIASLLTVMALIGYQQFA